MKLSHHLKFGHVITLIPPSKCKILSCFEGHTDAHADHNTLKNII